MSTFLAFLYAAVLSGVPLLYGTLGEIITEKAGHLNLGVEGMMYMGAAFAFMGGYISGSPVVALLFAIGAGVLGALIYAFLTITLKANQNVSGLALTTFGTGVANFLGTSLQKSSVSVVVVPASVVNVFKPLDMGFLSDLPVVGQLIFSHSLFTYLAVALAIGMHLYLNKTHCGLNLRAIGENPGRSGCGGRKRNAVQVCAPAGWRGNLRPGRRVYLPCYLRRQLAAGLRIRPGLDRRGAGHLCILEARQGAVGRILLWRAAHPQALCARQRYLPALGLLPDAALCRYLRGAGALLHPHAPRKPGAGRLRCQLFPRGTLKSAVFTLSGLYIFCVYLV